MKNNSRDKAAPNAIKSLVPKVSVCTGTGILTDTQRHFVQQLTLLIAQMSVAVLCIYVYIFIWISP